MLQYKSQIFRGEISVVINEARESFHVLKACSLLASRNKIYADTF